MKTKEQEKLTRVIGAVLKNANLPLPKFVQGHALLNTDGTLDTNSAGFRFIIDTLTFIRSGIIEQKFFKVAPGDYMPVDVGEAAWFGKIVQNVVLYDGDSFFTGDQGQGQSARLANTDALLEQLDMITQVWAKQVNWNIVEIAQAAAAGNWDVVSSKMKSLKVNWDLGIQETAFLGHPSRSTMTGLLTSSAITPNTTLLPKKVSEMSAAELATLIGTMFGTYYTRTNSTALPDTWIMPTDDFLGLTQPFSSTYPVNDRLSYLEMAAKRATSNPNFKIIPLAYCQAANNADRLNSGSGYDRHVLYTNDPDTLKLSIPVDFTMLEADTANKFNWSQAAYGQYSGCLITRPLQVMYMDVTTPST